MKKYSLKVHYITLGLFCQALAFLLLFHAPVSASANSLSITCPTEITPSEVITCEISSNSNIKIDKLTGVFSVENIEIIGLESKSNWKVDNSSTELNAKATSEVQGRTTVALLKIKSDKPDSTGTLLISDLVFEFEDKYAFSLAGPLVEIKILSGPELPDCNDDEELIDGVCEKKPLICDDDEELIDGKCQKITPTCNEDEELVDGVCKKKIITPVCKANEILKDNKCVKKESDPDFVIVGIIVGASVLVIGAIILIIFLSKRKKGPAKSKSGTYLNLSGGSYSPTTRAPRVQTAPKSPPPAPKYDNGNYMSRSGDVSEANMTPKANDDPRLQMQIQNPANSGELQKRQLSNANDPNDPNSVNNPNDPRLQIQFNNKQQEMALKQTQQGGPTTSEYTVAEQVTSSPEEKPKTVIQENKQIAQPVGPRENQYMGPSNELQQINKPTEPVQFSKPTTPDVFES